MKELKIFAIGDIVGKAGRNILASRLQGIAERERIDLVIANGENSAGGMSMTSEVTRDLFSLGIQVITSGNHVWNNSDILQIIDSEKYLLRPANYPDGVQGKGYCMFNVKGSKICVINLMGRVMMNPLDCPFRKFDSIYEKVKDESDAIIVDFHAEATSKKIAMGHYLDGRVAAVFGTHTHVQTSDAVILPKGTAYITDLGMTGPAVSVIGREIAPVLKKFTTGIPAKFDIAAGPSVLEGAILELDRSSGRAVSLTPYRYREPAAAE